MRWRALAGVLVSALGMGGASMCAVALADNASNAKAGIYLDKADCGGPNTSGYQQAGFVNYHRVGDTVTINYHLKGASPGATYYVWLVTTPCPTHGPAPLGTVTTNDNGVGNGVFSATVPSGDTEFYATSATNPNAAPPYNDSVFVTLPG